MLHASLSMLRNARFDLIVKLALIVSWSPMNAFQLVPELPPKATLRPKLIDPPGSTLILPSTYSTIILQDVRRNFLTPIAQSHPEIREMTRESIPKNTSSRMPKKPSLISMRGVQNIRRMIRDSRVRHDYSPFR